MSCFERETERDRDRMCCFLGCIDGVVTQATLKMMCSVSVANYYTRMLNKAT